MLNAQLAAAASLIAGSKKAHLTEESTGITALHSLAAGVRHENGAGIGQCFFPDFQLSAFQGLHTPSAWAFGSIINYGWPFFCCSISNLLLFRFSASGGVLAVLGLGVGV